MTAEVRLRFVRARGAFADLIAYYSHVFGFSHVDFVLPEGLLGARPDYPVDGVAGIQIRPFNYERVERELTIALETLNADRIVALARADIGVQYDWGGIERFVFPVLPDDPRLYFCSKFVLVKLLSGGFWPRPWSFPVDPARVSPDDLLLLLAPYAA